MKHVRLLLTVALAVALPPAAALAGLDADIAAILRDRLLDKATIGVRIVRLGDSAESDATLYRHKSDVALTPASNMKIITTSAALDHFGADFKFRTLLVQHGEDLLLIGDGDPSLGDAEYLKKLNQTASTVFDNWAAELKKAGLTSFRNLLVDDSIFDQTFVHPSWDPKQLHNRYSAPIAGLTLNANCVDFYVRTTRPGQFVTYTTIPPTRYLTVHNSCLTGGDNAIVLDRAADSNTVTLKGTCPTNNEVPASLPVHDPPMFAGTVLSESLAAAGVKLIGVVKRDRSIRASLAAKPPPAGYNLLAVHETPIAQPLARANKDSMNLYADSLAKRLGAAAGGQTGSWDTFASAASAFLAKVGANEAEYHIDDGSGLSHKNTISADAMVRILQYNFHGKNRDAFIASLAVPGQEGTLEKRFEGSDLRPRVFAKSGFINSVSALSGYFKNGNDQWHAFSILINGIPRGTNSQAKIIQENIIKAAYNLTRKPSR